MESAAAAIKVRYHIYTYITRTFQNSDGLWFVHFEGSWESLALGTDEPDLKTGDKIHITIESTR